MFSDDELGTGPGNGGLWEPQLYCVPDTEAESQFVIKHVLRFLLPATHVLNATLLTLLELGFEI